jgi:mono/diheme cytochrome c family protein
MSAGRAHLSVITLSALLLGAVAAWGFFNYVRAPRFTPELRGYQLAEDLGCHACHGPRGTGGVPNPGYREGNIPAWDGGMAMMYVENEEEIREWILDGRPWRLVMRDSLEARALATTRLSAHRARLDSLSASGDSAAAAVERASTEELLSRRLIARTPDGPPQPPLRMPAYRDVITDAQLEDLVAYYKVIAEYGLGMPDDVREGYRAARDLGCFGCHGPGGLIGSKNPRSFKGYIPPWRGDDFHDLVRDESELKAWILDGRIERLERNRPASFFTRRQTLRMPAYRGVASDSTLATVMKYLKWVSATDGH